MLDVAIDVAPLHGHRTGVGHAVAGTVDALRGLDGLALHPYVTSVRARLGHDERRLPIPAALAHRVWSHSTRGPMDRWLGRPDVVHGTNYVVPPARCPRIVSVYDCWFLDHPDQAAPDVRRAGSALRRAVDSGAHVVTSSEATGRRVRDLLDTDRVTTVHLGPPTADDSPMSTPERLTVLADEPFVLALGTVERRKNLPTLVAAFERLAQEHDSVRLVLAGADGDDLPAVTSAVAALCDGARRRTHRLGVVSDDEKAWLVHHAVALAYPSLDEGFGFPILEAQVAGTPVVASSAGSIPEIGGSPVLLAPPRDSDTLAANLYQVVTDPAMRQRMAHEGRHNVERFSWQSTAAGLFEVYTQALEEA